jgi:cyclophilin family peptidyl-prolyl cis-trans isomerase
MATKVKSFYVNSRFELKTYKFMKNLTFILTLSLLLSVSCTAQTKKIEAKQAEETAVVKEEVAVSNEELKKETMQEVLIETSMGSITIALFNETPLHRDNFIKLVNEKFYDGVLFHRIIQGFMIQTGDPNSKNAAKGARLGTGGPGYTIPAEFVQTFLHNRGAVAAARLGDQANPKRESSGSQFYIVDNKDGAHFLNGQYTIFGEVKKGMEVVDKIAAQSKDPGDRPLEDIKIISMKLVE